MTHKRKRVRVRTTPPTAAVAGRVRDLRQRRGWSAAELAARCADKGLDGFNRSVLANIESGRRSYVTVAEWLTLAYVLDVAPVHLLVPTEVDEDVTEDLYAICPDVFLPIPQAREWVRGGYAPAAVDPRRYFSEVPREEWEARPPTADQQVEDSERLAQYRDLRDKLLPPGHAAETRHTEHRRRRAEERENGVD